MYVSPRQIPDATLRTIDDLVPEALTDDELPALVSATTTDVSSAEGSVRTPPPPPSHVPAAGQSDDDDDVPNLSCSDDDHVHEMRCHADDPMPELEGSSCTDVESSCASFTETSGDETEPVPPLVSGSESSGSDLSHRPPVRSSRGLGP